MALTVEQAVAAGAIAQQIMDVQKTIDDIINVLKTNDQPISLIEVAGPFGRLTVSVPLSAKYAGPMLEAMMTGFNEVLVGLQDDLNKV